MKELIIVLSFLVASCNVRTQQLVYHGSTPAGAAVRDFLGISISDSIDFIRWKLTMNTGRYQLVCLYGLSKPNTNGFIDEQRVEFKGQLSKSAGYYALQHAGKTLFVIEVNANLLHLADRTKKMLVGNDGYSYVLNNTRPVKSGQAQFAAGKKTATTYLVFQGRTPCQPLSTLIGREGNPDCTKLKWYLTLYFDSTTGKASYYVKNGTLFRKDAMPRGNWEITTDVKGRVLYKLDPENGKNAIHLLKADDNILFFTDAEGNLLVGNEDFSYTLNRTTESPRTLIKP